MVASPTPKKMPLVTVPRPVEVDRRYRRKVSGRAPCSGRPGVPLGTNFTKRQQVLLLFDHRYSCCRFPRSSDRCRAYWLYRPGSLAPELAPHRRALDKSFLFSSRQPVEKIAIPIGIAAGVGDPDFDGCVVEAVGVGRIATQGIEHAVIGLGRVECVCRRGDVPEVLIATPLLSAATRSSPDRLSTVTFAE